MSVINSIKWLSSESNEAEVIVTDGVYHLVTFVHPFKDDVGDELISPIIAFSTTHIMLSNSNSYEAMRIGNSFEYFLVAVVKNKTSNLIELGTIEIELDASVPEDIEIGQFISFRCDRLD